MNPEEQNKSEEFEDLNEIKNLFEQILDSKVIVKDTLNAKEKELFTLFVTKMEETYNTENKIFEAGLIDLAKVTDPLWLVIENAFKIMYSPEVTELIFWYIFDRINDKGKLIAYIDAKGKEYKFNNIDDLWNYVQHISPSE
jgi:hypothetical protein